MGYVIFILIFAGAIFSTIKRVREAESQRNQANRPGQYNPKTGSYNTSPPANYTTQKPYSPTIRPRAQTSYNPVSPPAQQAPTAYTTRPATPSYTSQPYNPAVNTHLCEDGAHPAEKSNTLANRMFQTEQRPDASYPSYAAPLPSVSASYRRASQYRLTGEELHKKQQELDGLRKAGILSQDEYKRMMDEYARGY